MDFFTVPTDTYEPFPVVVIVPPHVSRRIVQYNITEPPTED